MKQRQAAKALAALWLILCSFAAFDARPVQAQDAPGRVHLQLDQARAIALAALRQGQPQLAFAITNGLLEADAKDGHALFIRAQALGQLKDLDEGRKTAAQAFRASQTDEQRFESATLAAQLSFADEKMTHSQVWLRRAVHFAPDEAKRDATIQAFRQVRHQNPLNLQLGFSVSPSDNVNNGANSPFNIIDGSPLVGTLSPSAQAIKGVVASLNVQGSYRIAEGENHQTRLIGRAYVRHVEFNNPVPGISASDLASQRFQVGAAHLWSPGENGFWRAEGHGGRIWYGGSPLYDFLSVSLHRSQKLAERTRLTFGGGVEEQFDQTVPVDDSTVWSALTSLNYITEGGSRFGARVQYREIVSDGINRASTQWTGILSYTHGQKIGPAEISVSVGHSIIDYDTYWVITPTPGGRTD